MFEHCLFIFIFILDVQEGSVSENWLLVLCMELYVPIIPYLHSNIVYVQQYYSTVFLFLLQNQRKITKIMPSTTLQPFLLQNQRKITNNLKFLGLIFFPLLFPSHRYYRLPRPHFAISVPKWNWKQSTIGKRTGQGLQNTGHDNRSWSWSKSKILQKVRKPPSKGRKFQAHE